MTIAYSSSEESEPQSILAVDTDDPAAELASGAVRWIKKLVKRYTDNKNILINRISNINLIFNLTP